MAPCVFGDLARSETEGDFQPKPEVHGCAGRGASRTQCETTWSVEYGASRRLAAGPKTRPTSNPFRNFRAQALGTLLSNDAELNPLQEWAVDLDYRKESSGLKVVEEVMLDLLPGLSFKGIDRRKRELVFETPDGEVPLARLSDGYQNMAGWCGDLLYRITSTFDDYKKPLEAQAYFSSTNSTCICIRSGNGSCVNSSTPSCRTSRSWRQRIRRSQRNNAVRENFTFCVAPMLAQLRCSSRSWEVRESCSFINYCSARNSGWKPSIPFQLRS